MVCFEADIWDKAGQTWHRVLPMLFVLVPLASWAYKKFGIYWVADGKKE